jgi:hypothetical protein
MHLVPEFLYQQHNFNSDAHHLNNHVIDMVQILLVQKYMRGMQPEWKRTLISVLLCTNSNTASAREFLLEAN